MNYGLRKGLEDIAHELKGIRNILASMWHSRYSDGETDVLSPEAYADEYVSTEECARRLGVSDQTLRNWMAIGRRSPASGWVDGVHYINICPHPTKKAVIRIPWNQLVQSFSKTKEIQLADHEKGKSALYKSSGSGALE